MWKSSKVMALDVDGMKGGIAILWSDSKVNLMGWQAGHFSLAAEFQIWGSKVGGTIVNIYGPSAFPQKQEFNNHLRCVRASTS